MTLIRREIKAKSQKTTAEGDGDTRASPGQTSQPFPQTGIQSLPLYKAKQEACRFYQRQPARALNKPPGQAPLNRHP